ncbi:apolipoprotein D-like isoform X1 [Eurosta solidaginis]|uniref:apolipoprotein D-like isoform X1 n=1 Tax=Eurosta solidaginis TaxID=178769 RepID=UPI003530DA09
MQKYQLDIAPFSILIFMILSSLVAGQVKGPGPCRRDITYLSSVDLQAFKGSWYMHSGYIVPDDGDYRCQKTIYTLGHNNEIEVKSFQIRNFDGAADVRTGTLTFFPDGQFQTNYNERHALEPITYKILSLDYEKYVIFYACVNLPSARHAEYLEIHTRRSEPPEDVINAYTNFLNEKRISTGHLAPTIHEDCGRYGRSDTEQLKKVREERARRVRC